MEQSDNDNGAVASILKNIGLTLEKRINCVSWEYYGNSKFNINGQKQGQYFNRWCFTY